MSLPRYKFKEIRDELLCKEFTWESPYELVCSSYGEVLVAHHKFRDMVEVVFGYISPTNHYTDYEIYIYCSNNKFRLIKKDDVVGIAYLFRFNIHSLPINLHHIEE